MLELTSTIQIKAKISIGQGKLDIFSRNESESYVAIVHHDTSVEVIVLQADNRILQADLISTKEFIDVKANQLQVLWGVGGQKLVIASVDQMAILQRNSLQTWDLARKIDLQGLDENGLISTLARDDDHIYIGTSQGLWQTTMELENQTELIQSPVTIVRVSAKYLAIGRERGGICVRHKTGQKWSELEDKCNSDVSQCCTDILIDDDQKQVLTAAYNTGHIRVFSLPSMELAVEVAAHIRWINRLIPISGGFLSAADDSFVHLWQHTEGENGKGVGYVDSIQMKDCLIITGEPLHESEGRSNILLAIYDRAELYMITVHE